MLIKVFNENHLEVCAKGVSDTFSTVKELSEKTLYSIVPEPLKPSFMYAVYVVYREEYCYDEKTYFAACENIYQVCNDIEKLASLRNDWTYGPSYNVFRKPINLLTVICELIDKTTSDIKELSDRLDTTLKIIEKHIEAGDSKIYNRLTDYKDDYSFLKSIQQLVVEPLYNRLLSCYVADNTPKTIVNHTPKTIADNTPDDVCEYNDEVIVDYGGFAILDDEDDTIELI